MIWFFIALFITGLSFIIFGLSFLFKRGFDIKMKKIWDSGRNDPFPHGYVYSKYTRGISFLTSGLIMVGFSIYILIGLWK